MFLDRLHNANPNNAYVMESCDVTVLFASVSIDSALQATNELLVQHQEAVNIWSANYFAQIRGLVGAATGN
ncbi:hypothetical protein KIN20_030332 [Parelaphostrongylus tenuis]|uniref:Uncharacterized protein n=1 Tax=Parelaphostrongylus tenuis TaxID=148309 RepID=A0AAD5R400_PARTN|nr:hypothetical protein KIN20_030332 [Parelaphostrongylus tenuis]